MKLSSNCEAIDTVLSNVAPAYKKKILVELKAFMLSSLSTLIEKYKYQISLIEDPNPSIQQEYKNHLLELKAIKDDLANPNSVTRKKSTKPFVPPNQMLLMSLLAKVFFSQLIVWINF